VRGLRRPVLDPLGLVENHDVRAQPPVDVEAVGDDLLVVRDREERSILPL
jgi:hypothetical protein